MFVVVFRCFKFQIKMIIISFPWFLFLHIYLIRTPPGSGGEVRGRRSKECRSRGAAAGPIPPPAAGSHVHIIQSDPMQSHCRPQALLVVDPTPPPRSPKLVLGSITQKIVSILTSLIQSFFCVFSHGLLFLNPMCHCRLPEDFTEELPLVLCELTSNRQTIGYAG